MQRYKREILQIVDVEFVKQERKLWSGKPSLFAYLISNKRILVWIIAEILLLYYERFQFLLTSRIFTIITALYFLYSITQGLSLSYYLIESGPVVKKGKKYYLLAWEDLLQDEYSMYGTILERLLGCRTIEFTRCYIRSIKKDEWKQKARFWSIKEYQEVNQIICDHII